MRKKGRKKEREGGRKDGWMEEGERESCPSRVR